MAFNPDRTLRRLILRTTAPLPRSARVWARYRLLLRLQMKQAHRADAYVVRHPKTGGTWLRTLITRLYANRYGLPSTRVVRTDELHRIDPAVPIFLSSSGYLSWERGWGDVVATDPVLREKKLLLLARHPCDIAVSWYIQFTKRTSAFKREMMLAEMDDPIDRESISQADYIAHPEIGLPAIIDFYNYWHRNVERMPNALVVRYEDLLRDTAAQLGQIGEFLGGEFSEEQIVEAVDFASFDKLRQKEQSGYFDNRSLRLRSADNPEMLKVRRAKIGGYRDDVTPELAAWMDERVERDLASAYGYHGGLDPVGTLAIRETG